MKRFLKKGCDLMRFKTANTHIFFHLTQLKHSDMSGNTCALGMGRNQESGERTAQEKAEWE